MFECHCASHLRPAKIFQAYLFQHQYSSWPAWYLAIENVPTWALSEALPQQLNEVALGTLSQPRAAAWPRLHLLVLGPGLLLELSGTTEAIRQYC